MTKPTATIALNDTTLTPLLKDVVTGALAAGLDCYVQNDPSQRVGSWIILEKNGFLITAQEDLSADASEPGLDIYLVSWPNEDDEPKMPLINYHTNAKDVLDTVTRALVANYKHNGITWSNRGWTGIEHDMLPMLAMITDEPAAADTADSALSAAIEAAASSKPANPYTRQWQSLRDEVAHHQLRVLRDDGTTYRHLRMAAPGTRMYSWDIVTWPGHLATSGDIASGYTFSRVANMLSFFNVPQANLEYYSDGAPAIDIAYWAQKLLGDRTSYNGDVQVYSKELLVQATRDHAMECVKDAVMSMLDATQLILAAASLDGGHEAAYEFLTSRPDVFGEETYDIELRGWNTAFVTACYAIHLTVQAYYTLRAETEAENNFVIIQGGIVQNRPCVKVFDMDVLKYDGTKEDLLHLHAEMAEHAMSLPRSLPIPYALWTSIEDVVESLRSDGDAATIATVNALEEKRMRRQNDME